MIKHLRLLCLSETLYLMATRQHRVDCEFPLTRAISIQIVPKGSKGRDGEDGAKTAFRPEAGRQGIRHTSVRDHHSVAFRRGERRIHQRDSDPRAPYPRERAPPRASALSIRPPLVSAGISVPVERFR